MLILKIVGQVLVKEGSKRKSDSQYHGLYNVISADNVNTTIKIQTWLKFFHDNNSFINYQWSYALHTLCIAACTHLWPD